MACPGQGLGHGRYDPFESIYHNRIEKCRNISICTIFTIYILYQYVSINVNIYIYTHIGKMIGQWYIYIYMDNYMYYIYICITSISPYSIWCGNPKIPLPFGDGLNPGFILWAIFYRYPCWLMIGNYITWVGIITTHFINSYKSQVLQ